MEPKRSSQNHIMQYKKRDERKAMLLTKKRGTQEKLAEINKMKNLRTL